MLGIAIYSAFAQNYEYKPFVEEGKTWWYSQRYPNPDSQWLDDYKDIYYGVSLRGDTIIEGHVWKSAIPIRPDGTPFHDCIFGFIREEGKKVITRSNRYSEKPCIVEDVINDVTNWRFSTGTLYDFSLDVGAETEYGRIIKIDTVGCREDRRIVQRIADMDFTLCFYEGIGAYTPGAPGLVEVFWHPLALSHVCIDTATPPLLHYVTDADMKVLFTADGGPKPWEQGLVEEVVAEPCGEAVYFNLQGQPCAEPLAPGIYIRRQGARAEKVAIR